MPASAVITPPLLHHALGHDPVPNSRDFDLGKPLVMRFAEEEFADHYDEVVVSPGVV